MKNNEISGTCSMYGETIGYKRFWWGDGREGDQWEDLGVDGKVFKGILKKRDGDVT
jgi:hypothetical protein